MGYRFEPAAYLRDKLGWSPWSGNAENPGQQQLIDAYVLAIRQQEERQLFENGELTEGELCYWKPNEPIRNRIRVESGGNLGKSKCCSGLLNHFYDHFESSVIYTFATKFEHQKRTLWKEIKADRQRAQLPGQVLDSCAIKDPANPLHFAVAVATSNQLGAGREGIQGQHAKYFMVVIDEAEGVEDYVFDALDNLTSGGISVVFMIGNPRTTTSRFHKEAARSNVVSFRMNAMFHPNALAGREVIPNAVTRQSIESMIERHCQKVDQHNPDKFTFERPWALGQIFEPDEDFLCQVCGIPSANLSDRTLIPIGRFEAAVNRQPQQDRPEFASLGIDCAWFGLDNGTLYCRHNGAVWREAEFSKQEHTDYYFKAKELLRRLRISGVRRVHIRIDNGGGFGITVYTLLHTDAEIDGWFQEVEYQMVDFGGATTLDGESKWFDRITELTGDVAESLKGLAIIDPPEALKADLCEREWEPRNKSMVFVKKLVEKAAFKKKHGRSPDDGDGFVLAVASEFLFDKPEPQEPARSYSFSRFAR